MAEKTISLSNLTAYNDNIKATYQAKTDSSLATTSKTVVGAINENKTQLDNITAELQGHLDNHPDSTNADTVDGLHFWSGTQAEYDAITTKDANTVYMVDGDVAEIPTFTSADGSKILAVNSTGTGLEWIDKPTGSGTVDLSPYQTKVDNNITGTDKNIVNAINNNTNKIDILTGNKFDDVTLTGSNLTFKANGVDKKTVTLSSSGGSSGITTKVLTIEEIAEILGTVPTPPPTDTPVQSVTASSNYLSINIGETRKITYTIFPTNATNKTITYSSSDSNVASVDQQGNVLAKAVGDILITLTAHNGVSTDCQVIVNEVQEAVDITNITLNKTTLNLEVGGIETLIPTITPSNATNKSLNWYSSDDNIATVNSNGEVTGVADGSCTIICESVSNPTVTASCSITVKTTESLTTVTSGLQHSYDFTNLTGVSTTIDDLTGSVPITMTNFTDVENCKTPIGIKPSSTTSRLVQGNMFTDLTGKYTIVVAVSGAKSIKQGLWGSSGIKVSCNLKDYEWQYTHSAYLDVNIALRTLGLNETNVLISAFDFEANTITTYCDGVQSKITTMDANVIWSNTINIFDGYSVDNNTTLCVSKLLLYNRCITSQEALKISNDITKNNRYHNIDFSKSTITNKQGVVSQYSTTSNYSNNELTNLVSSNKINNIVSVTTDGFLSSSTSTIPQPICVHKTFAICFKYNSANASVQQKIYHNSTTDGQYCYIQNNKLYIRNVSVWYVQGVDCNLIDGFNVFMLEIDNVAKVHKAYINDNTTTITNTAFVEMNTLSNTALPIRDFVIIDKILTVEEKTQLKNDLLGGAY